MPGKSPTELFELIVELRQEVAVLTNRTTTCEDKVRQADLPGMSQRLAVLEDRVNELKKSKDENDRRFWQFLFLAAGCVLTLLANVLVNVVLFAKK